MPKKDYRNKKKNTDKPTEIKIPENFNEPAEWRLSPKGREAISLANRMNKTKSGLYSSLPIICRGQGCKYAKRCPLIPYGLEPYGEVCAIEAAKAEELYESLSKELGINTDNYVDSTLLKELIDIEISLDRANRAIAVDGDFQQKVVVGIDANGRPLLRPELHQAINLKEKLQKRKNEILKALIATRQAKAEAKAVSTIDVVQQQSEIIMRALALGHLKDAVRPAVDLKAMEEDVKDGQSQG